MNGTWNLTILYTGYDDPAFAADLLKEKKQSVNR